MVQQTAELQKVLQNQKLQATAAEIASKCFQLLEIYKSSFWEEIPPELLQSNPIYSVMEKFATEVMKNPEQMLEVQGQFYNDFTAIYYNVLRKLGTSDGDDVEQKKTSTNIVDGRFKHPAWDNDVYLDFIKQIYLLIGKYIERFIEHTDGLDQKVADQMHLYAKNIVEAIAPSNFLLTNPELINSTIESSGERLLDGLKNFLDDMIKSNGHLSVSMTDMDAFTVGGNIATTPGKVIYQNDLMQLIQYLPTTDAVYEKPLLFIPPWINKYYVLDLAPEKSLVKWLVDQGFTVFMISWANPNAQLANKGFEDYMSEGPLQALEVITSLTKCRAVHAVGYCIGGTLLSATLSYMQQTNDNRVASATYLTTLLDFSEPGELGVFIDEPQVATLEKVMNAKGYLDGRYLDIAFNMLRPNDLIWPYFINNYLLGQKPRAFDVFYWNSDSTHLPAKMHNFYLQNMYLHNRLREPGGITLNNVPIDLKKITLPVFFISTEKDHIAPWKSTYAGVHLHSGPVTFVLSGSGHIVGVINPPAKNRYGFRTNNDLHSTPDEWLNTASKHEGSWWPFWQQWLIEKGHEQVPARDPVASGANIIEDAPGSYVLKRI